MERSELCHCVGRIYSLLHVADVNLGFEVNTCDNFVEPRQHMGRHHDVHSLLNSAWTHPETQLDVNMYTLVSYEPGGDVQT
jgi:hypothetical protein